MACPAEREFKSCLALRHTPGLGPRSWGPLLRRFGSAWEAYNQAGSWSGMGLVDPDVARAFVAREWEDAARAEYAAARAAGMEVLAFSSPAFPERLRQIPDPPLFLYCSGRTELAAGPGVAVVGTRRSSAAAVQAAERMAAGLSEAGITVVSGLARGIDRAAHQGALAGPGGTVAVLGCGLDVCFPAENAGLQADLSTRALVLSEFPPGAEPRAGHFPQRNRIISGLCLGVVVVEAPAKSGALITARLALDHGREVYVLEGPADSASFAGSRDLLEEGALRVSSAGEVILDLAPQLKAEMAARPDGPRSRPATRPRGRAKAAPAPAATPPPAPAGDTEEERAVLAAMAQGLRQKDELTRSLGWDAARTGRVLLAMELKGLLHQLPGMRYAAGPRH
ncbi:MAG: DNA-processing protein DprA [Thermodesulfobacteriota bacterium]